MATDTTSPPGPGGEGPRRPVTLDLSAEEVSRAGSEPVSDPADREFGDEPATVRPFSEEDAFTAGSMDEPWSRAAVETDDTLDGRDAQVQEAPVGEPELGGFAPPLPRAEPARDRRGTSFPALLLAAVLGGVVPAGGLLALERAGLLAFAQAPDQPDPEVAALRSEVVELGALRREVEEFGALQGAVAELGALQGEVANLSGLRSEVASLRDLQQAAPAAAFDAGPLQAQVDALEQAVGELRNRPAAAVAWPDAAAVAELRSRIAGLEQRPASAAPGQPTGAVEARLSELAAQVEGLTNSAAGGNAAPALAEVGSRIDEVSGRLGALEARPALDVAGLQASIEDLLRQAEALASGQAALPGIERRVADMASAQSALPGIEARLEELTARVEAGPKEERIAALETNLNATSRQFEAVASLGPAVTASSLSSALDAGEPFSAELEALRGLGLDDAALAGLAPHAEGGLPTLAELQSSFQAAVADIDITTPIPAGTRTVDRFLQSARSLVEVRPANPTAGGDPGAVLARMRGAVDAGDLRLALAEWNALPEAARARLAEWASGAQARLAAEELAARLRSEALARLKPQG